MLQRQLLHRLWSPSLPAHKRSKNVKEIKISKGFKPSVSSFSWMHWMAETAPGDNDSVHGKFFNFVNQASHRRRHLDSQSLITSIYHNVARLECQWHSTHWQLDQKQRHLPENFVRIHHVHLLLYHPWAPDWFGNRHIAVSEFQISGLVLYWQYLAISPGAELIDLPAE